MLMVMLVCYEGTVPYKGNFLFLIGYASEGTVGLVVQGGPENVVLVSTYHYPPALRTEPIRD